MKSREIRHIIRFIRENNEDTTSEEKTGFADLFNKFITALDQAISDLGSFQYQYYEFDQFEYTPGEEKQYRVSGHGIELELGPYSKNMDIAQLRRVLHRILHQSEVSEASTVKCFVKRRSIH